MTAKGRDVEFRCTICGRYVSYDDIENKEVKIDFTPDTEFTTEKTEMTHCSCEQQMWRDIQEGERELPE